MNNPSPQQVLEQIHAMAGGKKLVLHVGCGAPNKEKLHKKFRTDDWFELRCDINPATQAHIIADMKSLPMLPDGSVDAVWNSHTIEHLYAHEVMVALKEWRRVLKDSGEILMTLPDLQSVAAHVAEGKLEDALYNSPAGPISALDVVYGYGEDIKRGNVYMAHRTGFTAETLGKKLVLAGFANVAMSVKGFDLWAEATCAPAGKASPQNIRIIRDKEPARAVMVPTEPAPQKHPGALWKGKRSDELDVPAQKL
jgi:SAM-dependent methyltransferase